MARGLGSPYGARTENHPGRQVGGNPPTEPGPIGSVSDNPTYGSNRPAEAEWTQRPGAAPTIVNETSELLPGREPGTWQSQLPDLKGWMTLGIMPADEPGGDMPVHTEPPPTVWTGQDPGGDWVES